MSLIPFIIDLADELHELGRCLANGIDIDDFGFGIYAGGEHVQPPQHHQPNTRRTRSTPFYWLPSKRHHPYCRSKATCCSKVNTEDLTSGPVDREAPGTANTINSNTPSTPGKSAAYSVVNRNGFQVSMNVKQFAPNELSVKTINNCIIVEGRHDDKEDGHGVISRHFVRKYMLPKGYDPNDVTSTLSSDGILTVRAPPPLAVKNAERQERIVEIQPFSGPAQLTSAKENPKEPAKNILTANSTINQPAEKKQKLDQSQQSLQQTGDKVEENKLAEALRENAAKAPQLQNQQQQQQQQQIEPIDVIEKIMQSQQQKEEHSGQTNEGSTQTNVVVVSLNIEKLQENGDSKSGETLISKPEAQAETMLESSSAAIIIPAKTTEATEAKNVGATTTMRTVHNVQNDTLALTNSNEEHNSANSTVTLSEHQDANANITAVVANINSFVSTSASQPPPLLLRSSDNGIPDALPSIASQSTITGTALDDDDVEMDGAVASSHGNVEDEVALLKAVVVTTKTNDETTTTIADKECDLFVKTHLDNGNKATLALVNEEITK